MSLYVQDTKAKRKNNEDIVIGSYETKSIYYTNKVPLSQRVKELSLPGDVTPLPYISVKNQRYAAFISASSGAGKSVLAARLVGEIRRLRKVKDKRCIIFTTSVINVDPAYESLRNHVVIGFDDPIFQEINAGLLENKILLFDDWENIRDKKLAKQAEDFLKDCLERTRKQECDIIVINHQTQNYAKTKPIIFECSDYFLNLQTNKNSAMKFLDSYMDLDKETKLRLKNHESDSPFCWSLFRKSHPMYFIHAGTVRLL